MNQMNAGMPGDLVPVLERLVSQTRQGLLRWSEVRQRNRYVLVRPQGSVVLEGLSVSNVFSGVAPLVVTLSFLAENGDTELEVSTKSLSGLDYGISALNVNQLIEDLFKAVTNTESKRQEQVLHTWMEDLDAAALPREERPEG